MITKDLGAVSAYAYAVEKGYTGTEAEYAELMASYASVAEQASQSAQTATEKAQQASASATSASQSASSASASAQTAQTAQQTATAKASEAQQSAQTATTKAQEASQSASESSQSASTAVQAKQDAQTAKTASETAQASAESARDDAESARDTAQQYAESIDPQKLIGAYPTDTATGAIASFSDGADNIPMKKVTVRIEPKQAGTGDPSPDNVRPISGWDSVQVSHSGVNIWDEEWEVGGFSQSGTTDERDRIRTKNYIPCLPNTQYCYRIPSGKGNMQIWFYDSDKNYLSFYNFQTVHLFTTPQNCRYMRANTGSSYGATYNHDISINYPSTDTDYHPYSGQSINIQLGQTVYGGTLDVLSGELVIDRAMVDWGSKTFTKWVNDNNTFTCVVPGISTTSQNITCNTYAPLINGGATWGAILSYDMTVYHPLNGIYLLIRDTRYTDATAFNTAVSGLQLVYPLATPITVTLTPNDLSTLLGANNIWSDAGEVTAEYRADPTLYIQKKIAEAISALS